MNLTNIQNELNRMAAETLGENGRKLEALVLMIAKERSYQERARKILSRIELCLAGKLKRSKRTLLTKTKEKIAQKTAKSESAVRQMQKRKDEIFHNVIMQREALGITNHEWLERYYL